MDSNFSNGNEEHKNKRPSVAAKSSTCNFSNLMSILQLSQVDSVSFTLTMRTVNSNCIYYTIYFVFSVKLRYLTCPSG